MEPLSPNDTQRIEKALTSLPPIVDSVPAAVFRLSHKEDNWRTWYVSQNISMFGYTVEDFASGRQTWFGMVHPDDRVRLSRIVEDYEAKAINHFKLHYRILNADGETVQVIEHSVVNRDRAGRIICYDSTIFPAGQEDEEDLDRRRRQQSALNDILLSLHDNNRDHAIQIILDRTGHYLDCSRALLFKDSPDHKTCKIVYEWCNRDVESVMALDYAITYETGMPEIYVALRDEGYLLINYGEIPDRCKEEFDAEGLVASAIFAVYLHGEHYGFVCFDDCVVKRRWDADTFRFLGNVANLISTALARQSAEQKLEQNRKSYEAVLNNVDSHMFVVPADTDAIIFANRRFRNTFDQDCDGLPASRYVELTPSRRDGGGPERYEEFFCEKSGEWLAVSMEHITWVDGQPARLFTLHDITEKKLYADAMEAANRAKSNFLARTSHEIRTPMNAIMGMAELILRAKAPPDVLSHASDIKQASHSLLSIINDILDFSKIESGRMELMPGNYMTSSLFIDVINVVRMRFRGKDVVFNVDIDPNVPRELHGDEIRIRQVLLNILGNAIKYTRRGFVSLGVSCDTAPGSDVATLRIAVGDSGIGIKPEDMDSLFQDFSQVDMKNNRGAEGTGLGLAIAKSLCEAMGGSISLTSEYGAGSTFSLTIPQRVVDAGPLAAVDNPESGTVLVAEGRESYASTLQSAFRRLGVACRTVADGRSFAEEVRRGPYTQYFISADLYPEIERYLPADADRGGIVILADFEKPLFAEQMRVLFMPAQIISLANVLNDVPEGNAFSQKPVNGFTAPAARVLVVDDNVTNLLVASGLMRPYGMTVDTCDSGRRAVELTAKNGYDVVFMDHMMPEMDGIEATRRIRLVVEASGRAATPIVALTANAVSGMRDMFLSKGMDDFLAKPVEILKLDAVLRKWIPPEKRISAGAETYCVFREPDVSIDGVDMATGVLNSGGEQDLYDSVLGIFPDETESVLEKTRAALDADNLPLFTIHIHSLKSSLATIGAMALSETAAALEKAGQSGDTAFISGKYGMFRLDTLQLIGNVRDYLKVSVIS